MEVMIGAEEATEEATRGFFGGFVVLTVDQRIAEQAIDLRRKRRIKLPDAIIWATAQAHDMLLVTRNTKDFSAADPAVRMPYKL